MQSNHPAIVTTYRGPTNYKGSRISATTMAGGRRVTATVGWDSELNSFRNHERAAYAVAFKAGIPAHLWGAELAAGKTVWIVTPAPAAG